MREIQRALGISTTSIVDYHLRHLELRGLIARTPKIARSITLIEDQAQTDLHQS